MFRPVVKELARRSGYRCRAVSLCELRGLASPVEKFRFENVTFVQIIPLHFRPSSSTGRQTGKAGSQVLRRWIRRAGWRVLLDRPLRAWLAAPPELVVLPNDAAFPYDRIVQQLHARGIPFVLVQEGIRFPLPAGNGQEVYGRGGAAAIAAWGEGSAAYFRQQGVPEERIHLTGNPRFDTVLTADWRSQAEQLKQEYHLGRRLLLFLSNPIDDQGFCTTQEKLALARRFVTELASLFDDPEFHLVIKLHGRESVEDFQAVLGSLPFSARITVLSRAPLYPLFRLARAAVVMASTVGLEALLFGLPLGILEIPGTGFVYDYVSGDAAQGLSWNAPLVDQVRALLAREVERGPAIAAYLARHLATCDRSTDRIVDLVGQLVEGHCETNPK